MSKRANFRQSSANSHSPKSPPFRPIASVANPQQPCPTPPSTLPVTSTPTKNGTSTIQSKRAQRQNLFPPFPPPPKPAPKKWNFFLRSVEIGILCMVQLCIAAFTSFLIKEHWEVPHIYHQDVTLGHTALELILLLIRRFRLQQLVPTSIATVIAWLTFPSPTNGHMVLAFLFEAMVIIVVQPYISLFIKRFECEEGWNRIDRALQKGRDVSKKVWALIVRAALALWDRMVIKEDGLL